MVLFYEAYKKKKANLFSPRSEGFSSGDTGVPGLLAVFDFLLSSGYTCSVCVNLMTIFVHFPA